MLRLRNQALLGLLVASLLAASAQSAAPAPSAPWRPVDAQTGRITDLAQLLQLARAFPESASVQRRLLSAALREGNAEAARDALRSLEAMGYALSSGAFDALTPLIGAEEAAAAKARAAELSRALGSSKPFVAIPAEHRLTEGVAFDPTDRRLFVSSIVDRQLLRVDDGQAVPISAVDGGSLSGLAIDPKRRLLWAGSGVVEQTPDPDTAFRGLIAVDLDKLAAVRRIAAPDGVSLSDIAVAADGAVYASDPMGGGLYRLRPGAEAIETLVEPGTLRSPQGIAVHPSGQRLYVADYSYGIAIVDSATGAVSRLASAVPMMLDGSDGLSWFEDGLVAIQNGTSPLRIVRIALDSSGTRATGLHVVEANHPDWGEPTIGHVVGDELIYVSDPQWDRFGAGGEPKGSQPLRPNQVRITRLANEQEAPRSR